MINYNNERMIKKQSNDSIKNEININNNNFDNSGFEILSNNNNIDKDYSISSNDLFENNSYAGMNVKFENTDQKKARQDANNFLLKP